MNTQRLLALLQAIEALAPLIEQILASHGLQHTEQAQAFKACLADARKAGDEPKDEVRA